MNDKPLRVIPSAHRLRAVGCTVCTAMGDCVTPEAAAVGMFVAMTEAGFRNVEGTLCDAHRESIRRTTIAWLGG